MKKTLVLITAILLLTGCNQPNNNVPVDEPVNDQESVGTYKNEESNISFRYPSNWTINVPVDEPVNDQESVGTYKNEEFNISFRYPSNWTIEENDTNKVVTVQSTRPDNGSEITVIIPAESFDEYENKMSELIASEKMSVENNAPLEDTTYPSKKYGQEGWLYYLIEINGNYVGVGGEMYLTQGQEEGLKEILNSLSF